MIWYDLAEMLGGRTVEEWRAVMSIDERNGWIARQAIRKEEQEK